MAPNGLPALQSGNDAMGFVVCFVGLSRRRLWVLGLECRLEVLRVRV